MEWNRIENSVYNLYSKFLFLFFLCQLRRNNDLYAVLFIHIINNIRI